MYTEESVDNVKSAARVEEVIKEYVKLTKNGSGFLGLCPFHSEKTPSFKVSVSKNIYKCFGCGESGDSVEFLIKHKNLSYPEALRILSEKFKVPLVEENDKVVYVKPVWKNKTELSPKVVQWFEKRKITQETIIKMKTTDGPEWMPSQEKIVPTVQFNYFRKGQLINIKYRDGKKGFKLHKGSELIFFNIDSLIGKKEAWITEGEPDTYVLVQLGYDNDYSGVVSVPNGAGKTKNNLSYLDNCIKSFEGIERIHICTDDDMPGRQLREELAERFGKERCDYITWKGRKDANQLLIEENGQSVIDCCSNPHKFPIEGVFGISDISVEIDDMYENGLDKGADLKIPNFNLRIVKGYITTVTGIPSHGKSAFVDYMALNLIRYSNFKGAFYSPENRPTQLHFSKLARQLVNKHWDGGGRMTYEEIGQAKNFLDKKLWFIKPEKDFTLESILKAVRALQLAHGLDFFVIDAWNKLDHKENDSHYIGKSLDQIAYFCEINKLHCFLVAHPTKIGKNKHTGEYEVPTLYDISGSSNFYNKTDNGICIYRDFKTNETRAYRQKVKFDHWGDVGYSSYKFYVPSNRYYPEGFPDMKNWITGEYVQSTKKAETTETELKIEAVQTQIFYDEHSNDETPPF